MSGRREGRSRTTNLLELDLADDLVAVLGLELLGKLLLLGDDLLKGLLDRLAEKLAAGIEYACASQRPGPARTSDLDGSRQARHSGRRRPASAIALFVLGTLKQRYGSTPRSWSGAAPRFDPCRQRRSLAPVARLPTASGAPDTGLPETDQTSCSPWWTHGGHLRP